MPKGDEHKIARNYIYEEKISLTGKRIDKRGVREADGRMSYIPKLIDKNIEMWYNKPELEK